MQVIPTVTTFNFHYGIKDVDFYHFSFLPSGEMVLGGRNNIVLANLRNLNAMMKCRFPILANYRY